jgi:L-ascorbate metabolism protein UlaG (beta-lactamase superfamily)
MSNDYLLNNLKITWLGHAGFRVEGKNKIVYFDPYQVRGGPQADLILVTHNHFDHKDEDSLKILSKDKTVVLIGGENIREGEERDIEGIKIKAVPAYNLRKTFHPRGLGVGFVIEIDGQKIYHAGDTDAIPEMRELVGQINLALLPIGGTYTMDIKEAVEAVKMIKPEIVIPMHYGTLKETRANPEEFKNLIGSLAEVRIL